MSNQSRHPTAIIDPAAKLHPSVTVGAYSIIGPGADLAEGVSVEHHCVIGAAKVGEATRIRSFVELRDGTEIGRRCYIDSGVKSSGDCVIGDNVTLRYDAIIARGCRIGNSSFVSPQTMTVNLDHRGKAIGGARIGARVHVGTNATLQAGIEIGDDAVIGAKALVTKSVPAGETWIGIPARRR